jgi:hypothetical protein
MRIDRPMDSVVGGIGRIEESTGQRALELVDGLSDGLVKAPKTVISGNK